VVDGCYFSCRRAAQRQSRAKRKFGSWLAAAAFRPQEMGRDIEIVPVLYRFGVFNIVFTSPASCNQFVCLSVTLSNIMPANHVQAFCQGG